MRHIGNSLNGVRVDFGKRSDSEVEDHFFDFFLLDLIKPDVAAGHALLSIYVSSTSEAFEKHKKGGPHRRGVAIDISKINGMGLKLAYPSDPSVKAIVDALQARADEHWLCWENFGPSMKHKYGRPVTVPGHDDHIHWSVPPLW